MSEIGFPDGMITPFFGSRQDAENLNGWVLCDGKNGTPDLLGRFVRMISDKLPTNDTIHFKDNIGNSVDDAMRMCRQNDMDLATTSELRDAYNSGYRLNAFGRTVEDIVNPRDTFDMSGGGNQGAFCIAKTKILPHDLGDSAGSDAVIADGSNIPPHEHKLNPGADYRYGSGHANDRDDRVWRGWNGAGNPIIFDGNNLINQFDGEKFNLNLDYSGNKNPSAENNQPLFIQCIT